MHANQRHPWRDGHAPARHPARGTPGPSALEEALAEAGVDKATAEDVVARIADGYVPWQENSFPGLLGNVVAGRIANRFDLGGTNCVVDAACAVAQRHPSCLDGVGHGQGRLCVDRRRRCVQ